MNAAITLLNTEDILKGPLGASPLARPLRRLADDLNGLVRDGYLQGVELDLTHLDCPCFLLNVAPNKPPFYVELFRGDLDVPFMENEEEEEEEASLCVLMNWMGSDTKPAFWEADWEVDFGEEPAFGEVLSHILAISGPSC